MKFIHFRISMSVKYAFSEVKKENENIQDEGGKLVRNSGNKKVGEY